MQSVTEGRFCSSLLYEFNFAVLKDCPNGFLLAIPSTVSFSVLGRLKSWRSWRTTLIACGEVLRGGCSVAWNFSVVGSTVLIGGEEKYQTKREAVAALVTCS